MLRPFWVLRFTYYSGSRRLIKKAAYENAIPHQDVAWLSLINRLASGLAVAHRSV
jgi:hypothetical protein